MHRDCYDAAVTLGRMAVELDDTGDPRMRYAANALSSLVGPQLVRLKLRGGG